jgi:hypothetical protein
MKILIFPDKYLGQAFYYMHTLMFIMWEIIKGLLIFIIVVVISSNPLEFLLFNETRYYFIYFCRGSVKPIHIFKRLFEVFKYIL